MPSCVLHSLLRAQTNSRSAGGSSRCTTQTILLHCVSFLLLLLLWFCLPVHPLVSPFDTARKNVNHLFCQAQKSCQLPSPTFHSHSLLFCQGVLDAVKNENKHFQDFEQRLQSDFQVQLQVSIVKIWSSNWPHVLSVWDFRISFWCIYGHGCSFC